MFTKNTLHVKTENVAVPEIHTEAFEEKQKLADADEERERKEEDVVYDNVAIPEIHFHKKRNKEKRIDNP